MTPKEFYEKAATWASAIKVGDPGECLYGFDARGLVLSEEHRAACIAYVEDTCRKNAEVNLAAGDDPSGQHPELDELVAYLRSAPIAGWTGELDDFTRQYVAAALGGLDGTLAPEHLSRDAFERMQADCVAFQGMYGSLLTEENHLGRDSSSPEAAGGRDFWLTRVGDGAGFWDGDWDEPAASVLTEAAQSFGEFELQVGDDGLVHGFGGQPDPDPVDGASSYGSPRPF